MSRVSFVAAAVAVTILGGCQTFIGIEDVEGHLPHLDGDYLVGLTRTRADGTTVDNIRLIGTATLDPETRQLLLSLSMLSAADGAVVSETTIIGTFPEDASEGPFDLSITIRSEAVNTTISNPLDAEVEARMIMRAEGDYAFCAVPEAGTPKPSIGSILVAGGGPPPEVDMFDFVCDDL